MPVKSNAQSKLASMLARLDKYVKSGEKHERHLASNLRSKIRSHCEREGIPTPLLPVSNQAAVGNGRLTQAKPLHSMGQKEQERALAESLGLPASEVHAASEATTVLAPVARACPVVERSTHLLVAQKLAADLRRQVWDLLSKVDGLNRHERMDSELTRELGNLDAAAHMVAMFAENGRIEVASC